MQLWFPSSLKLEKLTLSNYEKVISEKLNSMNKVQNVPHCREIRDLGKTWWNHYIYVCVCVKRKDLFSET